MRYELYIRPPHFAEQDTTEALDIAAVSEALGKLDFDSEGSMPCQLDLGQGKLKAEAYVKEGDTQAQEAPLSGVNLGFPMGLADDQADRALQAIFALAQDLGCEVYDPQLGRLVSDGNHDEIIRCWRHSYEFQAEVVGAVGLGHGAPSLPQEESLLSGRAKYILALVVLTLVVIVMFRSCMSSWVEENVYQTHQFEPAQSDGGR